MSLLDMLGNVLGGSGGTKEISRQLGADEGATGKAVSAALPLLLGALSGNASKGDGAQSLWNALNKDHDGSVLNDPGSVLRNPEAGPGAGILRHVLGSRRTAVESSLSRTSGLDSGSTGKLLTMLAPLVMGALGKARREQNLDIGGMARMLGDEGQQLRAQNPQAMGLVGKLLDTDGDGDVDLGDLAKHGLGALGKLFGK
jgi:hypothetical protein